MRRLLAAAALAAASAGGCGGGSAADSGARAGPSGLVGVPIQSATCADWRAAAVGQRIATVRALQEAATPKPGQEHGATLDPERAYEILDHDCALAEAKGFLLYELYNRSASFAPLASPQRAG